MRGRLFSSALLVLVLLAACAAPPVPATSTPAASPTPGCPPATAACPATQLSIAAPTAGVKAFGRLELGLVTDGQWANPFDPAQVDLQVRFTAPDGTAAQVPAFWYQDFDPATLLPKGSGDLAGALYAHPGRQLAGPGAAGHPARQPEQRPGEHRGGG